GGSYSLYQQGTYAPDDGVHRWMGSVAEDRKGDIAAGYSVVNGTSVYPGIRYTGRLAGDPLGQMTLGEGTIVDGSGVQTTTNSRWGDYTDLTVDPVDDCTFWYVNENYLLGGDRETARTALERHSGLELDGTLATWEGGEAVEHLFRVVAGLDSLVPGEAQILGQVREAYEAALAADATGPVLNRLFEDALHAGKRVRTEAKLHEMPESVAQSAVELAAKELNGLAGKR